MNYIKALIVATGVFISTSIALFIEIPFGFLSIVTTFALLQLFFSDLHKKTLERIFGPTLSALLILTILMVFHNHFILMFMSSTLLLMIFIYLFAIGYFPYSMIMGGITISLISGVNLHSDLYNATQLGFYWIANILIGSLIVLVIDFIDTKWIFKNKILSTTEGVFTEQADSVKKTSLIDVRALIVACRVALTFIILLTLNGKMNWSSIDIPAFIAGIIISAQPNVSMAHQRALMRLLGVFVGALIAILFAYYLEWHPSALLTIFFMSITLGTLTLLSERFKFWEYAFLQTGIMLPLVLIKFPSDLIGVDLAIERSLGSIEGGLVAIAMIYLSLGFIRFFKC